MSSGLRKFKLLLWKNYVLQKRKPVVTVIEIGCVAFFSIILLLIRQRVESKNITQPTTFKNFSVEKFPESLCRTSPQCGFVPEPWKIYFAPNYASAVDIMNIVKKHLGPQDVADVVGFPNETAMVDEIMNNLNENPISDILGGIVFDNIPETSTDLPNEITYRIRLSSSPRNRGSNDTGGSSSGQSDPSDSNTGWRTNQNFPFFEVVGPREPNSTWGGKPGYMKEGFLSLQRAVDIAIIQRIYPPFNASAVKVKLQRFPYPPYNDDKFVLVLQQQFPVFLLLSFVFSALHIVKDIVMEKEKRLKETLKMMGISSSLQWGAWFLKYFIFLFIAVAIMTFVFSIKLGSHGAIMNYSSPAVTLIFLMSYSIAIIAFCFLVSVFFSKANSGAAAGGILFFVTYIPYSFIYQRYYELSELSKILWCLDFQLAMSFGARVISMFEGTGAGVQFSNINQSASVDDSFTMLQVILMLLVDSALYSLVAFYIEAVFPGEYGVPQPWYFPILKSYWCGTAQNDKEAEDFDQESQDAEYFERDPVGLKAGIRIKKLRKVFKGKVAVAGTSLNMYEGQITALLGHNGAGKTTTISMLTGFYPATSGTALVNGYDITKDINNVRGSLGICPQHDVLYDTLTVQEHLSFFAELKGCRGNEIQPEVDRMTEALGLDHKKNAQSKTLSGGMKRKLSVAMALVGGSKIVILDEPTSGMDPNARRKMWDILQRHRENRTMVLTTHFMDEADILGDRIAIMAEGVVKCCGSSLFLKNKYGAGYHMVIVKEPECDVSELTRLVQSHVPSAQLESDISAELSYILPQDSSHQFEALFTEIENNREKLGVASYGASVTTMEEVFLRVGEGVDLNVKQEQAVQNGSSAVQNGPASSGPIFNMNIMQHHGFALLWLQFKAMFVKRALHTMRNWLVTATQLVVPIFFTAMALLTVKLIPKPGAPEPLLLTLAPFGENYVAFSSGENTTRTNLTNLLADSYGSQFRETDVHRLYLNNLTKYAEDPSVSNFLVNEGIASLGSYTNNYLIAASFEDTNGETNATGLFNNQAYHTPAIALNAIDNTLLSRFVNSSYSINTYNEPLPKTISDQIYSELNFDFNGFLIAFNVMFGMAFLASSFVVFLIGERAIKAKHCQFVSGAKWDIFWVATMLWDIINYMIPCLFLLVVFAAFDVTAYTTDGHLGYVLLLLTLFGWSMLPLMYILSFLFKTPSTGFVWLSLWNVLAGIATVMAVVILGIPGLHTESVAKALEWVFYILIPNFCLGQGLMDLYNNYQYLNICTRADVTFICENTNMTIGCCKGHCGDNCVTYNENYLGWEAGGLGRALVFMAAQGCIYLIILSLIESGLLRKFWYKITQGSRSGAAPSGRNYSRNYSRSVSEVQEDDDVMKERDRVTMTPVLDLMTSHSLVLVQLTKSFGSTVAVDRLSIGIKRGECFGLLGNNGAGKTTTFRMLTGDETIGSGDAYLEGCDIKTQMKEVQRKLGYCPQFDALIDKLTGRETLRMYARLRGIHERQIEKMVQQLIDTLLLEPHADKLVKSYSGGNKRKLSTAIALVGDPPVVFLDEPTTGMDPVARRQLWDTLSRLRAAGTTLILTSHSMEECEALCTQIAIMVNGQVKCLGSTQHLKNKFGEGYTLIARVGSTTGLGEQESSGHYPLTNSVMSFIQMTFPNTILKDVHQNTVHYYIPTDPSLTWAKIFGAIENNKKRLKIEDYSVSQTTLEQVFINFARAQVEPREINTSCFGKCKWCLCGVCCCGFCCNTAQDNDELVSIVDREHRPPTYT